jgi:hypothetical protein
MQSACSISLSAKLFVGASHLRHIIPVYYIQSTIVFNLLIKDEKEKMSFKKENIKNEMR